jgi:hypothetical protein
VRRTGLTFVLASAIALACCSSALALGVPINVGTPLSNDPPAVAVDAAGTAYVAWPNTRDLSPNTTDVVQYCVLPAGAGACAHAGTLTPADGLQSVDRVQVLVDGSTVVILADVFGNTTSNANYSPVQEWQSTDGGTTFNLINAGLSVTSGAQSIDTGPLNAVIVPGTNTLGYGWERAAGTPTFNAFPLASPPECSQATPCPFATLEPDTNPNILTNSGGQIASQLGANPGVLALYATSFDQTQPGPFMCSNLQTVPFGTAFAYGSGTQSPTNDYNISPGSPNSAWKLDATQADCNVDYAAVAGGPSGFGVIETNELTRTTVYHRFNQTTLRFDTPLTTVAGQGEQSAALSQDGAGGVYATYLLGGVGGPIGLAYSYNGGLTWVSNAIDANTNSGAGHVTSLVNATGQGWAAWTDNGSVFAQPFNAADSVAPPAADTVTTMQTAGTVSAPSLSVPAGTIRETDRATISGANAASATGAVTYTLYSSATCAASAVAFRGGTAAVSGGVAGPASGVSTALAPGKYYWQAVYSGNAGTIFGAKGNLPAASACGAEVLNVGVASTLGATATSTPTTVTVSISCATIPCTVTVTVTATGVSAAAAAHKKPVTLAKGTFTIRKKGAKKLTVRLTSAGRKVLRKHHGRLKATLSESEKLHGRTFVTTRGIRIKPKHK